MPGKVKVKIVSGRNLPVMDRSSDTTDAYVEIKLGGTTYKTDVCRKSLNPHWNSEWYKFEVDDSELQDEPLQIRLMDHDTYSANDAIGKVYIDLNPLLLPACGTIGGGGGGGAISGAKLGCDASSMSSDNRASHAAVSGWFPVFDTMHGIRGEVRVTVKVELFSDFNKYRQSSCGVQFFCSAAIPHGFHAQTVHGFVEELIVNDDPEYQWIDKIRTPRASNEARQTLFFKLSGELQRKIGVKALDLGGNAVIGYCQYFDLEGESGIVARGIGTAVTLLRLVDVPHAVNAEAVHAGAGGGAASNAGEEHEASPPPPSRAAPEAAAVGHQRADSVGAKTLRSPAKGSGSGGGTTAPNIHRRSSDSDLSITPKGNSLTGSDRSGGGGWCGRSSAAILRHTVPQENFDIMEYPFLTMAKYPRGFIAHLGGTVSARSVKLLERITNFEEPESRDTWWSEIRMEIRSHARALNCNAVLGYAETTTICEDVCVLSASGTAAIIGYPQQAASGDFDGEASAPPPADNNGSSPERDSFAPSPSGCALCHVPQNNASVPLRNASSAKCRSCKSANVPDVLISTIEIPDGVPIVGRGCFLQSHVCRTLRDARGESNAKEISDGLPFLEYELHRLLLNKLKVKAMNAIFGLRVRISIGERMLIGIATGTAVFLAALPSPATPKLVSDRSTDDGERLATLQKQLRAVIRRNKEVYQLKDETHQQTTAAAAAAAAKLLSDTDDSEDEPPPRTTPPPPDYALHAGAAATKDCCILEVDDPEDEEVLNLITEPRPPDGFHVVNSELVPGLDELEIVKNLQMFIQVWRTKIQSALSLDRELRKLLQTVYFKLRRMIPCALCDLQFRVNSPEADEIQLCVLGMALGLGDPPPQQRSGGARAKGRKLTARNDEELIFNLEEEDNNIPENGVVAAPSLLHAAAAPQSLKHRQKSPQRAKSSGVKQRHVPYRERHGVDITPLSYVPGGKIERYLGNLNFFFIRETTSIREEGGLSGFLHSFVTEVLAIVRAHVTALGGNAMVAYFMTECILNHNLHKNQGQCLINVGGDVVFISYYYADEMQ